MSIPNRRLEMVTERILREELQKGNLPTSREFAWRLSQYLSEQDLRRPEYVFKAVYKGTKAVAGQKNEDFKRIGNDLTLLYQNMDELMGLIGKKFSSFDLERERLEQEIRRIETRIKEKVLLYAQGGFLAAVYDVFDDLSKVDQSATRNVIVDTTKKEVRLTEEMNRSVLVLPPSRSEFLILENVRKEESVISGPLSNAFAFEKDIVYQTLVQTQEDVSLTGRLELHYGETISLNEVEVTMLSSGEDEVSLSGSHNGVDYYGFPYNETGVRTRGVASFRFPTAKVKHLRIDIKKARAEESRPEERNPYRYLFGFKEVRVRQASFMTEGVFQTVPLLIEGPKNYVANKVALEVDEFVPDGTNIRYEVALEQAGELDWRALSPINRENPSETQLVDFQMLGRGQETKMGLPEGMSINQSERPEMRANGIRFYEIGGVSGRRIIEGSGRLYKGRDVWEVKGFEKDFGEGHLPSIEDWREPEGTLKYEYPSMEEGKESILFDGKKGPGVWNYIGRCGLFYEERSEVRRVPVVSTEEVAIYLNGEKVFAGKEGVMNIRFAEGWNEILVCVYARNMNTVNGITVDTGIQMRGWFSRRYASPSPMEQVPVFDLRFNTRLQDRKRYSLVEGEAGYEVIVNHGEPGLEYDFFYEYAMPMAGLDGGKILLRATMTREGEGGTPSPSLRRYRIQLA